MKSPRQVGIAAAIIGLVVDQLHKWYMLGPYGITEADRIRVLPFMDWVLVWNRGVWTLTFDAVAGIPFTPVESRPPVRLRRGPPGTAAPWAESCRARCSWP